MTYNKDYTLSNERDEFGKPFVLATDGTTVFGVIGEESGLTPAPIKLSEGEDYVDNDGRHHGYGLKHIEAGHGEQIRAAGLALSQNLSRQCQETIAPYAKVIWSPTGRLIFWS